jgi:3-oxoacyl-[acyl-carrier-protein] synthase II
LVSALGVGTDETWKNILAGKSGVGTITHFDTTGFASTIAGEVKNFDPLPFVEKKEVKKMGLFIQFAMAATQYAMAQSGLTITPDVAERAGVYIGSGIGGFDVIESPAGRRSAQDFSLLYSRIHCEPGFRICIHSLGSQRS